MPTEGPNPRAGVNVPELIFVGRFSGDHQWPVLGDRRGRGFTFLLSRSCLTPGRDLGFSLHRRSPKRVSARPRLP